MKPYYDDGNGIRIFLGDCRDVLPTLAPESVDLVLTDPPYGVQKAEWDGGFSTEWMEPAARVARNAMAVMPGNANLLRLPERVGRFSYKWTLSVHVVNAIVRGATGFGNWIPCVVYVAEGGSIYTCSQDAGQVAVSGRMPDHPSPKPYHAMRWMVSRLPGDIVLDPFMGSGTTLRAAKDLGRRVIGIEVSEAYCETAARRLQQSVLPLGA